MNERSASSECLTTEAFYVQRTSTPSPHYLGGPTRHSGTNCPECEREVTLVWDLDLTAENIPAKLRQGYRGLSRLPLYVCSLCSVLSYQVLSDDKICCFPHGDLEWCFDDESPHSEARAEIERQSILLNPMTPEIDELWVKDRSLGYGESLGGSEGEKLRAYLDSLESTPNDLHDYSQLCGSPYWVQGSQITSCPNPKCDGSQDTASSDQGIPMKRLAHICAEDSPGLGDSIGYFDFQFLVCPECFSISVQYECT